MTTMTTTMMRRMTRSSGRLSLGRVVGVVDVGHVRRHRGVPQYSRTTLVIILCLSAAKVPCFVVRLPNNLLLRRSSANSFESALPLLPG
jgi:hypothetical protein